MLRKFLHNILLKKGWRKDELIPEIFYKFINLKNIIVTIDTSALLRSQYWTDKEMKDLQLERIKSIALAAQATLFWQEKFIAAKINPKNSFTWEDFKHLPITERTDYKNKPDEYFINNSLFQKIRENVVIGTTSGSTAEPFKFFQDFYYEVRSLANCRRILLTIGRGKLLPLVQIRSRFRRGFADKKSWWFYAYNHNQLKYRIRELAEAVKKNNGAFILYGFSSYLIEIARLCLQYGIDINPIAVIATGEGFQVGQREYVESSLKTEVFNIYVTNELGWLAFDCENHNLHINSEFAYLEIIDNEGTVLESGKEGRIIVTTFDNKIMPFIRYDTGDIGTILTSKCSCGRTLPLLKVQGRQTDVIQLENNRQVALLDVLHIFVFKHEHIRQYQIIQEKLDEFRIKIIPEIAIGEDTLTEIESDLRRNLHPAIKIKFEMVEEIESTTTGKKINFKSLIH